jgi:DNA-directed RNA polymerase specialized sigma24 family protein
MTKNSKKHTVDTLGDAPQARFTVLHKRVPLPHGKRQDNGLSEAFVAHLCPEEDVLDAASDSERDELADLDQQREAVALARLEAEHPDLYGVVWLVDYRGLSLRETGRCLKKSHPTVSKHHAVALAKVRAWCTDIQDAS